jgi:hypothetical protein
MVTMTETGIDAVFAQAMAWLGADAAEKGATAREHPYPRLDQAAHMRLSTWRRLSPAQRWLSGVA